ncbi:homeobox domain-containing protein [Chloropicon primus]|uniref:Homeobox domain-containing protein n=1 Tax=Chloropicon primus TaxID=1764295 RepID=A0A5B8MR53_9CHLO|nr:hypothetical protein A3770_09p57160 [Chloropicon primus]UPR02411.1 homeobox domain-containing protein [Chloropicon primus]|mmetsp:Transcript_14223/g.40355  ORF Transcript_14223/g.40355 Transcript_14223/m.40355 type:complete len:572 (-) Transcript_14223:914-2629(-)|eukprot:QDZ23198.1 hypothetical protein A3770_09p57160 [Chloropicon primus]
MRTMTEKMRGAVEWARRTQGNGRSVDVPIPSMGNGGQEEGGMDNQGEGRTSLANGARPAEPAGERTQHGSASTSGWASTSNKKVKLSRVAKRGERGLGCAKCRRAPNGCSACGYYTDETLLQLQLEKEGRKRTSVKRAAKDDPREEVNPFEKAKRRVMSQISRIKKETWLLETYEMEGWRGASKEKLKPKGELERARNAIEQAKTVIQDNMKFIEEGGGFMAIPREKYTASGQLDEKDIFCAKCLGVDAPDGNDIILCDGFCGRAYHQKCLDPPLKLEDLPPDDEGWLCPSCCAKADCVYYLNNLMGTAMPLEVPWHAIYSAKPEDSDSDAAPGRKARREGRSSGGGESGNGGPDFLQMDLPSEESEDEDFEPSSSDQTPGTFRDAMSFGGSSSDDDSRGHWSGASSSEEGEADGRRGIRNEWTPPLPSDEEYTDIDEEEEVVELVEGKRRRKRVDYKKLNEALFGETEAYEGELVSDNEWDPLRGSPTPQKPSKSGGSKKSKASKTGIKRTKFPEDAVKRFRTIFAETPTPAMELRKGLSKEYGLTPTQVNMWFASERFKVKKKALKESS